MLSARMRPAGTRLRCSQSLLSQIFEHAVMPRPSACPPTPPCSRPACITNGTYSILSVLASRPLLLWVLGTRDTIVGLMSTKQERLTLTSLPTLTLHRDRSPESAPVLQQWPLLSLPVNEGFASDQCDTARGSTCLWDVTFNTPSNITHIPPCWTATPGISDSC